jgi:predicted hydrocarbon binding protein
LWEKYRLKKSHLGVKILKQYEKMLINLMDGLDKHLEFEKKILLLEECGRKCIRDKNEKLIQKANKLYKNSNDLKDFLGKFSKIYDSLKITDDEIIIIWEKCLCPIINKIPTGMISSTFCNCSRGWVKELFEGAIEKPVEVILEESITKGNSRCKLRVNI